MRATRRMAVLMAGAVLVLVAVMPAGAGAGSAKGSSCTDPYRAYVGQPKLSIGERLLGDTGFITMHHHELPRANNNTAPIRRSYTWHGTGGAHMCEFHIWITDAYRNLKTNTFEKPVTIETPLDSHNPNGGKNVEVRFKYHCGPIVCKEREGQLEYHEVLTAAR